MSTLLKDIRSDFDFFDTKLPKMNEQIEVNGKGLDLDDLPDPFVKPNLEGVTFCKHCGWSDDFEGTLCLTDSRHEFVELDELEVEPMILRRNSPYYVDQYT